MKMIKKISALLLCICLLVPCFSMVAHAADGRISFSDPQTRVGDLVDVKMAVRSTSGNFGNLEVKISYDASYLRFNAGDGVTKESDGVLSCSADGGSAEQIFMVKFQALKEGTTAVEVSSMNVVDENNAALTLEQGKSTVTIAAGDPSKIQDEPDSVNMPVGEDVQVEVNGQTFTLTDKFSDADIPTGYKRTQINLDGVDRQMVENESNGVKLGYLMNEGTGEFYVFNEENATFSPYAEIAISDTASIVLISDTSEVTMPDGYKEATLTMSEKEFPVWQTNDEDGFYILYAINGNGEKEYYRYDPKENTYQRYDISGGSDDSEDTPTSLFGKIQKFIQNNLQKIMLFGACGLLIILLIIIILGTKLRNRNLELDELYDEYGIDEEPEVEKKSRKEKKDKKNKNEKKKSRKKEELDDEFEDDSFETSDMSFETSEFGFETSEIGMEEDDFETSDMGMESSELDFETSEIGFETSDMSFETSEIGFETSEFGFETSEIGMEEDDFETSDMSFETSDLDLESVEKDDLVVYGGESRKEELTIDDLDDLLNKDRKNEKKSKNDNFVMDFIDLD